MELELEGQFYRVGKVDVFAQLHIARKLAPIMVGLGVSLGNLVNQQKQQPVIKPSEGEPEVITEETEALEMIGAFGPAVEILAKMPEDDVNYVIKKCLSVCSRKDAAGWQSVLNRASGTLQYDDITMPVMVQLTMAVCRENKIGFFEKGDVASGPATQPR